MVSVPTRTVATAERPATGPFSASFYRDVLAQIHDHNAILTLTVSNGTEERVFFFTRGAIRFLATGASGGEVLAKKIVAKGLLPQAKVDALVARANSDTPLLQDILETDGILTGETVKQLVDEVLEDNLVELAFWDGLYDLNPGNPPPRIYENDVPAVRLSLGLKPLLERVRPKVAEAPATMATLGGSLRSLVRTLSGRPPASLGADEHAVFRCVTEKQATVREVLDKATKAGVAFPTAAASLAALVRAQVVQLEKAKAERTRVEEQAEAQKIEGAFELFVNRLLARTHLAQIYERTDEKEKAAEQYRGIAQEHLKRDNVQDGLGALRQVLRFVPQDLEARELLVQVLQSANRVGEAAREAVELGRLLITRGLPGRARHAFELALKLVPGSMNVLWMLGGLLARLGYQEDAVKVFEEIADRAKAGGDEPGAIAAYQQILGIDPLNSKAIKALRQYGGYTRALAARYSTAGLSVLLLLVTLVYGGYETLALEAYKKMRDEVVWPSVDERKFDVAREAVNKHLREWDFSWTTRLARSLLDRVAEEEQATREQAYASEVRAARKLDAAGEIPEALERWQRARETQVPERQRLVTESIARDEARVKKANDGLAEAKKLATRSEAQAAHEILVQTLGDAPWLLGNPDVRVPCRVETVPRGARVYVDGVPNLDPTPAIIHRKAAPGNLIFEARGCEIVKQPVEALPPWPITVLLPRRPVWRAAGVSAPSAPLVAGDLVIAAGTDRNVTALGRIDGKPRWTRSLGVFGETDLAPVLVGKDALAVRTAPGDVVLLDLATGLERWRRPVALPPVDPTDPYAARPRGCAAGVLVREGARNVVLLGAKDGKPLWTIAARADVVGAPEISGTLVGLTFERQMQAYLLADGSLQWTVRLPRPAITSAGAAPDDGFEVAIESDDLARIDRTGAIRYTERDATGGRVSTAIAGDALRVLVGSSKGEVLALNSQGKVAWRATTEAERSVRWVRSVDKDLVVVGDEAAVYALDGSGQELWRSPAIEPPVASGDDGRVFLGGPAGLAAFER